MFHYSREFNDAGDGSGLVTERAKVCWNGARADEQPAATVVKVGPTWAATLRYGGNEDRSIRVRCPFCRRIHRHGWPAGHAEPGLRVAHCHTGRPDDENSYWIPAPGPEVPIPGVCGRVTRHGGPCERQVRRQGDPCNQHRRQEAQP